MENLLIIKNISNKIYVDPFFYLFAFISCLSANFKNFFFFLSIIVIHELGHLLTGLILGWKLDKIYIYPYGGATKFNEDINRKIIEEITILLGGPFLQIVYLIIGTRLFNDYSFIYYNFSILLFNLLPIYPLDGGRILNLLFNYFISFRMSYYLSISISFFISFLMIVISIDNGYTFNIVLMFLIVMTKVIEEFKKRNYYFNKFILERYMHNYSFVKLKIISSLKKMMRDKRHIIKINNIYMTEKEYLNRIYRRK